MWTYSSTWYTRPSCPDSCGIPRCRDVASVAAHRGRDVGLVAGRIRERPPGRCVLVPDQPAAGRKRRGNARLRGLGRDPDRDVDGSAPVGPRLVHLLEPEGGTPIVTIDQVLVRAVGTRRVPERSPPEGHDRRPIR